MAKSHARQLKSGEPSQTRELSAEDPANIRNGPGSKMPRPRSEEEIIRRAKKYYEDNRASLSRKYQGKYVAIRNDEIIDSDRDFASLAARVYQVCGYQTIYMPRVNDRERTLKFLSPRIRV